MSEDGGQADLHSPRQVGSRGVAEAEQAVHGGFERLAPGHGAQHPDDLRARLALAAQCSSVAEMDVVLVRAS